MALGGAVAAPWLVGALSAVWPAARWTLPFLAAALVYPPFAARVRRGDTIGAWRIGMAWSAALSAGVLTLTLVRPEWAAAGIVNGPAYRDEMLGWIDTGVGREGDWRAFLPQHGLHLAAFVTLTLASGGYLGLALGAALLAYMNFFVASYADLSANPWLGVLIAWVPWSILRVMAFVLLGALLAAPILRGGAPRSEAPRWWGTAERRLFWLVLSGLLGDILLKTFSAARYGEFLRDVLGP
jgi:hypothetical protein